MRTFTRLILLSVIPLGLIGCRGAQVPSPPVTTVWQKLGVPQAAAGLRDGLANRRGNLPGLERKPPLARLVDAPALDPESKLFEASAEIKKKEDLKKQKLKALKYLAAVGCGCYNDDGAMEAALIEALDDCDVDVRLAAAEAIAAAAGDCACHDGCATTCCTEDIQEKLMDMSRGEKDGCFKEPSAEVRQAATRALTACPPIVAKPEEAKKGGEDGAEKPGEEGAGEEESDEDKADKDAEPVASNSLFQFNNHTWLPEARHLTRTSSEAKRLPTPTKVEESVVVEKSPEPRKTTSALVVKHRPLKK